MEQLAAMRERINELENRCTELEAALLAVNAERGQLREVAKKALTCASLNSDVRALIGAVLDQQTDNQGE